MRTRRFVALLIVLALVVGLEAVLMSRCTGEPSSAAQVTASPAPTVEPTEEPEATPEIDLDKIKPNEAGEIPIVMFHAFVDELDPDETYSESYLLCTQSFSYFRELLPRLYDMGYRLISMNDFLNNEIKVEAGYKPIVFTFDDGTSSQFSLIEQNGELTLNPDCAAAIILDFYEEHPDFGKDATFYVCLGNNPFYTERSSGPKLAGTLQERMQYLVDLGFDVGNHTYTHYNLSSTTSADDIIREVGQNQAKMYELVEGYTFTSFALPFGNIPSALFEYVKSGVYEGVAYYNQGIVEAGWDPAISPVHPDYDPYSIDRVSGRGFKAQDMDLIWWLENPRQPLYVSDGDPYTITVPEDSLSLVDESKLGDRQLRVY